MTPSANSTCVIHRGWPRNAVISVRGAPRPLTTVITWPNWWWESCCTAVMISRVCARSISLRQVDQVLRRYAELADNMADQRAFACPIGAGDGDVPAAERAKSRKAQAALSSKLEAFRRDGEKPFPRCGRPLQPEIHRIAFLISRAARCRCACARRPSSWLARCPAWPSFPLNTARSNFARPSASPCASLRLYFFRSARAASA